MAAAKVQPQTSEEQGDPWPVFKYNFLQKKNLLISSNSAISYHKHDRPVTFCLESLETTVFKVAQIKSLWPEFNNRIVSVLF